MPGSTRASGSADGDLAAFAPRRLFARRAARHRGLIAGATVFGLIVLAAIFAPLLTPQDPYVQNLTLRLKPPAWSAGSLPGHLLGTDHLGRDYLARLLHGARISLMIGLTAASIGAVIGTTLGIVAGYFGGRVDQVVSYLLTCQLALPTLLLAMALVFLIGPSVPIVIAVIGLLHWSKFLVVARAATMQLRDLDFVRAARAFGSSRTQILVHEILPNLRNQVIVIFTLEVGIAIVAEASLSFLGVGVPSPTPSWGLMIAEGRNYMMLRPEVVLMPGIALFLLVVAINMMGDGLRDVTAPEARG
ncbi:MAG: ABC transporter permease [Alphaproteobacteria bacterium]